VKCKACDLEYTEWEPIKLAPKDGQSVVLCGTTKYKKGGSLITETKVYIDCFWRGNSWCMRNGADEYGVHSYCHSIKFTHWYPIPSPPKEFE
jgi:hypothetical protein